MIKLNRRMSKLTREERKLHRYNTVCVAALALVLVALVVKVVWL